MNTRKVISLAIAAVLVVAIVVIVLLQLNKPKPVVAAPQVAVTAHPMVKVVVAKTDLKIGQRLTTDDMMWQEWPVDAVNPAFITDGAAPPPTPAKAVATAKPDPAKPADSSVPAIAAPFMATISGSNAMSQLAGAVVREPILAKEPIVELKIVRAGEGGMVGAVLPPGMRAVSIPVTAETGAGGLIQPGDRVDVIQNRHADKGPAGGGGADIDSRVVLRNLRVIAIDQNVQANKGDKAMIGTTATLEVRAGDTPVIARAKSQGDIVLALRSYADAGGPSGAVVVATPVNRSVKIYRAGQRSDVTVTQ
jgi:pilus assembly protein CpaB